LRCSVCTNAPASERILLQSGYGHKARDDDGTRFCGSGQLSGKYEKTGAWKIYHDLAGDRIMIFQPGHDPGFFENSDWSK